MTGSPESYSVVTQRSHQAVLLVRDGSGWSLPAHADSIAHRVVADLADRYGVAVEIDGRAWELTHDGLAYGYLATASGEGTGVPSPDTRWVKPDELADLPLTVAEHRAVLSDWAASRTPGADPLLTQPWADAGWRTAASEWITAGARAAGHVPTGPVEQFVSSPYSYTSRLPTDRGAVWFKSATPSFRHEPALVDLLHRHAPGIVPTVLAHDPERRWLLTDDIGPYRLVGDDLDDLDDLDTYAAAVTRYARLQRALVPAGAELAELGVPDRRLSVLPDLLAELADDHRVLLLDDATALTPEEHRRLVGYLPRFADLCADLAGLGLPEVLQNTDFWRDCVLIREDDVVLLDWAESVLANPLSSLTMVHRDPALEEHPQRQSILDRLTTAYLDAWADLHPRERLAAELERARPTGIVLRALSWRSCMDTIQDLSRYPGTRGVVARNMRALLAFADPA
ncbi:hypothetical protein ABZS77_04085 [Micromonospora sp. NPDC005298]|uniref:hypothetical protein n=1 Tax=Micromonospora sp. NPDC005298 TaxID=3156873 RepID=UPI0033A72519